MKRPFALALAIAGAIAAGCAGSPASKVALASPTDKDIDVLRVVLDSAMRPRLEPQRCANQDVAVMSKTLTSPLSPLAQKPPVSVSVPPPPPPPLSQEPVFARGPSTPVQNEDLEPAEREAWQAANTRSREIPGLGLTGFSIVDRDAHADSCLTISVTAPAYPTATSALVYADFLCGGLCGEGWLIHLTQSAGQWVVTQQQMLIIR